jgi:dTDP-glucose pyrophosphorylase
MKNDQPMKPSLLIMAAGMASRYGGLKQLEPVGPAGETLMEYSIYDALRAGFGKVVFVIRQSMEEEFRRRFAEKLAPFIEVAYVYQEIDRVPEGITWPADRVKPWGSSHAVLAAAGAIREPFAVINADDYYGSGSFKQMAGHLSSVAIDDTAYAMIGFGIQNTLSEHGTVSRGICECDEKGLLRKITERTRIVRQGDQIVYYDESENTIPLVGDELVSMNFWGFTPVFFVQLNRQFESFIRRHCHEPKAELPLPPAVDGVITSGEGTVKVLPCHDQWFGVTYKEDKPRVVERIREMTRAGTYPPALW